MGPTRTGYFGVSALSPGLRASWGGVDDAADLAWKVRGGSGHSAGRVEGRGRERDPSDALAPTFPSAFLAPPPQTLLQGHLGPETCLGPSKTCFILFPSLGRAGTLDPPSQFSAPVISQVLVDKGRHFLPGWVALPAPLLQESAPVRPLCSRQGADWAQA